MPIKVVHFSTSPLAGAPVRIVSALREHTQIDARLVDLDNWNLFDTDVIAAEQIDFAAELANNADIIHLHNCINLNDKRFSPINFRNLAENGKIIVRQYHSPADAIASRLGLSVKQLAADEMPSMVVAQYHERFFPKARVVPNIVNHRKDIYSPDNNQITHDIFFGYAAAYKPVGAWQERWATKGAPQMLKVIEKIKARTDVKICVACDMPHAEMTALRSSSKIVLDELITGSYHISALEALAAGRVAISYLDQRCREIFSRITNSAELPFINAGIEDLPSILERLLNNPQLCTEIGKNSRKWFEQYYAPEIMVNHYEQAYNDLINDPDNFTRQDEMKISNSSDVFFSRQLPDIIYQSRRKRFAKQTIAQKLKIFCRKVIQ